MGAKRDYLHVIRWWGVLMPGLQTVLLVFKTEALMFSTRAELKRANSAANNHSAQKHVSHQMFCQCLSGARCLECVPGQVWIQGMGRRVQPQMPKSKQFFEFQYELNFSTTQGLGWEPRNWFDVFCPQILFTSICSFSGYFWHINA